MYSQSPGTLVGGVSTLGGGATLAYTGFAGAHYLVAAFALIALGAALWRLAPRRAHVDA